MPGMSGEEEEHPASSNAAVVVSPVHSDAASSLCTHIVR